MTRSTEWQRLERELDAWQAAGRVATFWWRDDDATRPSTALDRLIEVSASFEAPAALAVVPAPATDDLPDTLAGGRIEVLQHGYAHINHAPRGQGLGAWELGLHRPKAVVLDELRAGKTRLDEMFDETFVPALVPPWGRIDEQLFADLPGLGFTGLSMSDARSAKNAAPGLPMVNVHFDVLTWKGGVRYAGTDRIMDDLVRHLEGRRMGTADPAEPTGLLTHHLDMDNDSWGFVEAFVAIARDHPAAMWQTAKDLFDAS